jgi:hypothetical protein
MITCLVCGKDCSRDYVTWIKATDPSKYINFCTSHMNPIEEGKKNIESILDKAYEFKVITKAVMDQAKLEAKKPEFWEKEEILDG